MSNNDESQSPNENLRLDVGGRNIVSSSGWKSYFIGAGVALVVGVGLFTLGRNTPDTFKLVTSSLRRE